MTEPLRRITIDAELPEHLAAEVEQAIAAGQFDLVAGVIESALVIWSYERWPQVDPTGWRAHVAELQRRCDEADAHPEDDMDVEDFSRELETELQADEPALVKAAG